MLAKRILVIEDNPDTADSLAMILTLLGHEVQVAYNGPDGVRKAVAWRPDVVLSDIGLPGLTGYQVAERLRQSPETARARLVAITGYGDDDDRRRAYESGFDFHFTKPADTSALLNVIAPSVN